MSVGIYGAMVGLGQAAPTIGQGVRQTIGAVQFGPVRKRVAEAFALLTAGNTDSTFSSEARGGGAKAAMPATTPAATTLAATAPATGIASTQPQAIERSSQEPPMVGAKPPLESGAARPLVGQNQSAASGANRQRVMEQLKQDLGILSQSDDPRDIQTVERIQSSLASLEQRRSEIEIQQQESIARRALEERQVSVQEGRARAEAERDKEQGARMYTFTPEQGIVRSQTPAAQPPGLSKTATPQTNLMTFKEAQDAQAYHLDQQQLADSAARTQISRQQLGFTQQQSVNEQERSFFYQSLYDIQKRKNEILSTLGLNDQDRNSMLASLKVEEQRLYNQYPQYAGNLSTGGEGGGEGGGGGVSTPIDDASVQEAYQDIVDTIGGKSPTDALNALGRIDIETPAQRKAFDMVSKEVSKAIEDGSDVAIQRDLARMAPIDRVWELLARYGGISRRRLTLDREAISGEYSLTTAIAAQRVLDANPEELQNDPFAIAKLKYLASGLNRQFGEPR